MRMLKYIMLFISSTIIFSNYTFAENTQIVDLKPSTSNVSVGQKFSVTAEYNTQEDAGSFGLGLRIHFDSTKVKFVGFKDSFLLGKIVEDVVAKDDTRDDYDLSTATDKFVVIAWVATADFWPNMPTPIKLSDLLFEAITSGNTSINASFSSVSSGFKSQANSADIIIK